MPVRVTISGSSREWWTEARAAVERGTAPAVLLPLLNGIEGEIAVEAEEWQRIREWGAAMPGWTERDGQEQLGAEFEEG